MDPEQPEEEREQFMDGEEQEAERDDQAMPDGEEPEANLHDEDEEEERKLEESQGANQSVHSQGAASQKDANKS